jgi:hypothetical protein
MSTILDALRKVEEEKRTQETDVRTRLLSNSPRFDFRTPRRSHTPWIIGGGLVFLGIVCGAGLMLWQSSDTVPVVDAGLPPTSASQVAAPQSQTVIPPGPQLQKPSQSEPQAPHTQAQLPGNPQNEEEKARQQSRAAQITPSAAAVTPPKESTPVVPAPGIVSGAAPTVTKTEPYNPWNIGNLAKAAGDPPGRPSVNDPPRPSEEVVQRSPFVNSSPNDQIAAPPPPPPSAERQVPPVPPSKPVRTRPQAPDKSKQSTSVPVLGNDPTPSPPAPAREQTQSSPSGASLSFLQWSADPEKRVVSIKVGTGPSMIAHEGDSVEGLTVVKIRPDAVEIRSGDSHYLLKAR